MKFSEVAKWNRERDGMTKRERALADEVDQLRLEKAGLECLRLVERAIRSGGKRRSIPDDCKRPAVLSITQAADILTVEDKSDRFAERFFDTGLLAADRLSRQRWRFDLDELEALRDVLAASKTRSKVKPAKPTPSVAREEHPLRRIARERARGS